MTTEIQDALKKLGRNPKEFIYEDNQCVVFDEEYERQAPIHFVVVPKRFTPVLSQASVDDEKNIGHLLLVANDVALKKGLGRHGYHLCLDENHKTKTLRSLHVFGRALHHMIWPCGPGPRL